MKKKLLIIGNFLSAKTKVRGACEDLALMLERRGYSLFCASYSSNPILRLQEIAGRFFTKARMADFVLIEVYSGNAFLWAEFSVLMCGWFRKPFLLWLHGGNLPVFARKNKKKMNRLFCNAVRIICPSEYLKESMRDYGEASRFEIIGNGFDLQRYKYRQRKEVKAALVWLRAFHRIYAPWLAVEALELLVSDFPDISLTMVGPDKKDGSLSETKALIKSRGLDAYVRIVEGVPKESVPGVLSKGDIFLNTAMVDNFPVSVLESMACGLCLVSLASGGVPHMVKNEEEALLVDRAVAQDLADAVKRILKDPDLAARLSEGARRKAESCDWSVTIPLWEKVFQAIP